MAPSVLSELDWKGKIPPTHFTTNKFTSAFQGMIDTYGSPRYKEINPSMSFLALCFCFQSIVLVDFAPAASLTWSLSWENASKVQVFAESDSVRWSNISFYAAPPTRTCKAQRLCRIVHCLHFWHAFSLSCREAQPPPTPFTASDLFEQTFEYSILWLCLLSSGRYQYTKRHPFLHCRVQTHTVSMFCGSD